MGSLLELAPTKCWIFPKFEEKNPDQPGNLLGFGMLKFQFLWPMNELHSAVDHQHLISGSCLQQSLAQVIFLGSDTEVGPLPMIFQFDV